MSSIAQPVARSVSRSVLAGQRMNLGYLIRSMFSNSEQGFAYDPNDLTTLYQDAAGTIPVTAAGQPVGLMLDKSKGLVLGNELLSNSTFESSITGWYNYEPSRASLYWDAATKGLVIDNTTGIGDGYTYTYAAFEIGRTYKITGRLISLSGHVVSKAKFYFRNGTFIASDVIITNVVDGSFTLILTPTISTDGFMLAAEDFTRKGIFSFTEVSVRELAGNHAYQTTSASRPLLQRNATTGAYYLAFDGTDDFLMTNAINFTATDKVSLFAGVRKLSDVGNGTVVELSTSDANTGMFYIRAPSGGLSNYQFLSKGTSFVDNTTMGYIAPISNVVTCSGSISGKLSGIRVNGLQYANNGATQGAGNYGNYPLYIGRRAGESLPFNGHLYSLIGIGRLTTDVETTNLEKTIAKNVGVTL